MKRKPIKIFLAILILLVIPLCSTLVSYYTVAAADFFSPNLNFEGFDQEYLVAANQSELKISGSGGLFNLFQLATFLFRQSFHFFSQISSLEQKTLVLRC